MPDIVTVIVKTFVVLQSAERCIITMAMSYRYFEQNRELNEPYSTPVPSDSRPIIPFSHITNCLDVHLFLVCEDVSFINNQIVQVQQQVSKCRL